MIQINPATGKALNGTTYFVACCGEASYVMRHGSFYYLFVNKGLCCSGLASTYYVQVGRSLSPTGPYLDRNGVDLNANGGTPFLSTSGHIIGPGHVSYYTEGGIEFVTFHYYEGDWNGTPRDETRELLWDQAGWPYTSTDWLPAGRYKMANRDNGLVWTDAGQTGASLDPFTMDTDIGGFWQAWDFTPLGNGDYKITSAPGGLSLDAYQCSPDLGTPLDIYGYWGGNCQMWKVDRANDGSFVVSSRNGHRVIDVPNATTAPGTRLHLWDANSAGAQKWQAQPSLVPEGIYYLSPQCARDECLDVTASGTVDGTPLQTWSFHTGANQLYQIRYVGNGCYKLLPQHVAGKALSATNNTSVLRLMPDQGGPTQQFTFTDTGGGWYKIQPQTAPNSCIEVALAADADGSMVRVWPDNGLAEQRWRLSLATLPSATSPTSLQAVAGDHLISLAWLPPANGALGYNIYRGTSPGGEATTPIATSLTATTFTDFSVTNGQTYFYYVTAAQPLPVGESAASIEVSARPRYATSSVACQNAIQAAGPVAYWRFNETNGSTAVDRVGGHHGVYGQAVTLAQPGPRPADFLGFELTNTAAQFVNNLTNSFVAFPALNLNTNTVTITAWIYPVGSQAAYAGLVFCRSGSTVAGMNMDGTGANLGYTWNNNSFTWSWSSGVQPPAHQWSFVALVAQATGATVYLINTYGQQAATNSFFNPNQSFAGTGTIGTDSYSSAARTFNGLIDEVAVFNYALTGAQIQQLYASGHNLTPIRANLQRAGTNLTLTWPQGTLCQSPNLNGPWTPLANRTSPATIPLGSTSMFYRVLLQQ